MLTDFFCAPWAGKPIIIDLSLCEHNWHELQLTLSFIVAGQTITALPFGVSVVDTGIGPTFPLADFLVKCTCVMIFSLS